MTIYETTNHTTIRMWCEANGYWPACVPGSPERIKLGGDPFAPEPEKLELLDWEDWFAQFDRRQLKFVYDPSKTWIDLQSRNVRPD